MSIRSRLVTLCLVISLLPAIPLSLLVKALIEKSFDVGLSNTVEAALQSGLVISRDHLNTLHVTFENDVERLVRELPPSGYDSTVVAAAMEMHGGNSPRVHGWMIGSVDDQGNLRIRDPVQPRDGITFFESADRSRQVALWNGVLFFSAIDSLFLGEAERLIEGRQIFAQLRLTRPSLARSFFLPFVVIYAAILLLSIGLALFMSQRLSRPIRDLAEGAHVVAGGNWDYRLEAKAGGEVGRLVDAFNGMVARLDDQRRRLIDMERMATWRDMARHLAHEIKNPLLPIRLTIQELKDQYRGDDPRYREILVESTRVVGDELDHLKNLVKEFSSFARMPDIAPRKASLDVLVKDVAKLYPQVGVAIDSQPGFPAFIFDPDQIRSVLVNLFDNAVIAMEGKGSIGIAITQRGRDAVIEFADNGPGIAAADIDRIFDPYFTTRDEGTGLGLAMVKNVILLHGGTIRAHSAVGKGTIFTITLPLAGPDSIHKEI